MEDSYMVIIWQKIPTYIKIGSIGVILWSIADDLPWTWNMASTSQD